MRTNIIEASIGGVPFIDAGFEPRRLLAAVAATRLHRRKIDPETLPRDRLEAVLKPEFAVELYKGYQRVRLPTENLSLEELSRIKQAQADLINHRPEWARLISLPIRFMKMTGSSQSISASIDVLPQHVFLSAEAFVSDKELREQILHETCHNWLYLISEVWRLHWTASRVLLTLPSGTTNRTPSELIGALHVASVLLLYYGSDEHMAEVQARDLAGYRAGCLELASAISNCLTDVGKEVAHRLNPKIGSD